MFIEIICSILFLLNYIFRKIILIFYVFYVTFSSGKKNDYIETKLIKNEIKKKNNVTDRPT